MKKKYTGILCISLAILITLVILIQGVSTKNAIQKNLRISSNYSTKEDGRLIKKLQWYSPNGELPGSYYNYKINHPFTNPYFLTLNTPNTKIFFNNHSLAILVEATLYPTIETNLSQYLTDLQLEGYTMFLDLVSGGTPEDIKSWIQQKYNEGTKGILFIGDVTAAWVEVSGEQFPSDFYYMDLDGSWQDDNGDGVYETHEPGSGDMGPEVYVSRIYASSLSYDSESNLVNDYFAKVHKYRTGHLTQPWRGLEYVEEDWFDMDVALNLIYEANVTRYDYGYFTTAEDYLNQMDLGQHFVQVCVHSYSGGHYFSTRPTESAAYAHVYVYSPTTRSAKLHLGSDDGVKTWVNGVNVITRDRYGGWIKDQYTVDISLNSGWNQLLCKISQQGGDYRFSFQLTDMNGMVFDDLIYQLNDPAEHGREAEYIRSFLLNGFHQDTSDNFWEYLTTNYLGINEGIINPDVGDVNGGNIWTVYSSGNPYINIGEYCKNADYGVCYAFVRVYASTQTSCQLWMGYDDGARVWLNGNEVLFDNRYGGFEADIKKVNVTLHKGENRLLIKISEWMGDHGFSARFCTQDGGTLNSLTYYDPEPIPITYIGTWLINGPYTNPDKSMRLKADYIGDEGNVTPCEGDDASFGTWERGVGDGCPFNIGGYYDHGSWVLSKDIQDRNPPVLFYNLFACGPGRFTDDNYLAGSYVFHTTYGLITIASSKSGSMLNFDDFNQPFGEGKSIGESFCEWFDIQAPYELWEKEWYYGMVIFGDPTLCIPTQIKIDVVKPENAIYIWDKKIIPFTVPMSFGNITIEVSVTSNIYDIEKVEFYVDDLLQSTDNTAPYCWTWDTNAFFKYTIKVKAYDTGGHNTTREFTMWKYF